MAAIHYPEPLTDRPPQSVFLDPAAPEPRPARRHWLRPTLAAAAALMILTLAGLGWLATRTPGTALPSEVGFAELYLRTYLTDAGAGTEDVLTPFLGFEPDLTGTTAGTWYVTDVVPVLVNQRASGSEITLAVDLLGSVDGGYREVGMRFYQVVVTSTETGLFASGLPAQVAQPALAPEREAPDRVPAPAPDEPLVAAVTDYLEWYLVGTDGPYSGTRPGPVYRAVTIAGLTTPAQNGEPVVVEVDALATDHAGRTTMLGYTLTLSNEQGVWVVMDG